MIAEGAAPDAQRLPVGLLHAGRHARPARHARAAAGSSSMMAQVATLGLPADRGAPAALLHLFWHALDIVWIGVFTIVYLGARW